MPIDAYGNHGFRFAGLSHQGSLLALPSGMYGWPLSDVGTLTLSQFDQVFCERDQIGFVLLGTGLLQVWPEVSIRRHFEHEHIGLEAMDTGAAVRTYNVLLAEKRPVAAALIAVDHPR